MFDSTKVAVLGAGLMGCGIAQVFASHKLSVLLFDPFESARETALSKITSGIKSIGGDIAATQYVNVVSDIEAAVATADVIIEAVPEKLALKQEVFRQIQPFVKSTAIVTSNTSVIPIKDIFDGLDFQNQVVGTHWWNPPYLVPLVEVVESEKSSTNVIENMMALLTFVGKKPVHVKKDVPGFVGNRMQHALWREAIALVNDGVCTAEDVDVVVKNSFGLRLPQLGPIENADLIGLDLTLDIHNVILQSLNADKSPSPVLQDQVAKNNLGVKTGQGFLSWNEHRIQKVRDDLNTYLLNVTQQRG
ncbi:3-hydroxyacyl-CoA dehydrogenase family protein [Alteromonas portus]|uniref:3-hydroxyacyl-CoA dehydrogenase family protein n=1 Tax=Alteromonas portus TaxID=2565549 RepID=UPI003BF7C11D